MQKPTVNKLALANKRVADARWDIAWLEVEIGHHNREASRLRKERQKHKAKINRALSTIERLTTK